MWDKVDNELAKSLARLRELSLAECARTLGIDPRTLSPYWSEIPTAYRTPGGFYRVTVGGFERFVESGRAAELMGKAPVDPNTD